MFRKVKIGTRLISGFLAITALLFVLGGSGVSNVLTLRGEIAYIHDVLFKSITTLSASQASFLRARALVFEHILAVDATMDRLASDIAKYEAESAKAFEIYVPTADEPRETKLIADYQAAMPRLVKSIDRVIELSTSGEDIAAQKMANEEIVGAADSITGIYDQLIRINIEQSDAASLAAATAAERSLLVSIGLMILSLAAALVLGLLSTRMIVKPLAALGLVARSVASGDLSKGADPRLVARGDELGSLAKAIETMRTDLAANIRSIEASSRDLGEVGAELGTATAATADSVREITSSVGEARKKVIYQSSSIVQTSATIEAIITNINTLNDQIESQAASVTQSSASIEEMVSNIQSVTRTVEQMADCFVQLQAASEDGRGKLVAMVEMTRSVAEQSEKLYEANGAISDMASQTNLLAMNAAIEAAHAGDSGKGFAVVADEIRNLAESSALRSKEIAADIKSIKSLIDSVALSSTEAESAFTLVMKNLETVSRFEHEIKQAMGEQNEGSKQVLEAIEDINTITVNVRNGSGEINEGSKSIGSEMRNLATASEELRTVIGEVESASGRIGGASSAVKELSGRNESTVQGLKDIVSRFKL